MNAIYARQSVDRADSISIESQIEFCLYELKGEGYQLYTDKGYSGKNTDRPAFLRLVRDIELGLIHKVVVYKLDRISRSILDFSSMMEKFQRYKVEFISTMEKFDTSSPMGRAMLSICIVFAQLERETIQRRVADTYLSRSQKGFYMGGRVPYGFRLAPTILNGVRTAKYEVIDTEAEVIKEIYRLYASPRCSCGDISRQLNARDLAGDKPPKWSRGRIAALLKNPVYVQADHAVYSYYQGLGIHIVNGQEDFIGINGCYLFSPPQNSQDAAESGHLVLAPHEGIISSELWLKCCEKLPGNTQIKPRQKAKNTWLAGKIKCGCCGYALVDKRYPTGYRYLLCSHRMNTGLCPGPGTIYTEEIEQIILTELTHKLNRSIGSSGQHSPPLPQLSFEDKRKILELLIRVIHVTDRSVTIEWRV